MQIVGLLHAWRELPDYFHNFMLVYANLLLLLPPPSLVWRVKYQISVDWASGPHVKAVVRRKIHG